MCSDCWEAYGRPTDWTPEIANMVRLLRELNRDCPAGGHMHIVTDDYNVEDGDIEYCRAAIQRSSDPFMAATLDLQSQVCSAMSALTPKERIAALAWADGLIGEPPDPE